MEVGQWIVVIVSPLGAAVLLIILAILALVLRRCKKKKKSRDFGPHNFVDRPKSGIRGLLVKRKPRDVRKTATLGRYVAHNKHVIEPPGREVWFTGQSDGYTSMPLFAPAGTLDGKNEHQQVVTRDSDHRASVLSEVSANCCSFRQLPPGAYSNYCNTNQRFVAFQDSRIQIQKDDNQRLSKMSKV